VAQRAVWLSRLSLVREDSTEGQVSGSQATLGELLDGRREKQAEAESADAIMA
jgi:hypothetical protein